MGDRQQVPLPCPFCGSTNVRMRKDNEQLLYCGNCRQRGPSVPSLSGSQPPTDEEKAMVLLMWNHREGGCKECNGGNPEPPPEPTKQAVSTEKEVKLTLNGEVIRSP